MQDEAAQQKQAGSSVGYKALARAETVQAWQINAHYDRPPLLLPVGASSGSEERLPLPAVPPIKTRVQQRSKVGSNTQACFAVVLTGFDCYIPAPQQFPRWRVLRFRPAYVQALLSAR